MRFVTADEADTFRELGRGGCGRLGRALRATKGLSVGSGVMGTGVLAGTVIEAECLDRGISVAVNDVIENEWLELPGDEGAGIGNPSGAQQDIVFNILAESRMEVRSVGDEMEVAGPRISHRIWVIREEVRSDHPTESGPSLVEVHRRDVEFPSGD